MRDPAAVVIPFPRHAAPRAAVGATGMARLQAALVALNAAVQAERAAIAGWRQALAELDAGVGKLHRSLSAYQARLGGLKGQVDALHTEARRLESWADGVLAAGSGEGCAADRGRMPRPAAESRG
jgi:small-conductance mechanosensitive channel